MRSLTVKEVAAINRPGTWRVSRNLYVQVGDTGTKAWLLRYTLNGRAHGMGLGSLELVTLAEARDKAILCRKLLLEGIDPLDARRHKRMQALLADRGRDDHLPRLREAIHRGPRQGLEERQAPSAVAQYSRDVCLSGDRRAAGGGDRHRSDHADHRAALDHQDRDRLALTRPACRSTRKRPTKVVNAPSNRA